MDLGPIQNNIVDKDCLFLQLDGIAIGEKKFSTNRQMDEIFYRQ
ncbi:hypothetical protein [Candidatus Scalindua japonica]|nr:hypothetical protein [Candidatus Scalindua japonica]